MTVRHEDILYIITQQNADTTGITATGKQECNSQTIRGSLEKVHIEVPCF